MNRNERWQALRPRIPGLIALVCGALAVGLAAYFMIGPARGYYHADCADTIFWSEASWDAKALYNTEFTYACLLPFGGELLMMPFVALFGVSFTAHTLGMLLFLAALTAAVVWFCRTMDWSWGWTGLMLTCVLGVLCLSEKLREIYFGHIIYYSLGGLFLLVGLSLLRRAEAGGVTGWRIVWLCVWFFLCSLNGLSALALFAVPALGGYYGERFTECSEPLLGETQRPALLTTLFALLSSALGYGAGILLAHNVTEGYANAYSGFSPVAEWSEHLLSFLPHWLTLLGVNLSGSEHFMTADGIAALLRIGGGILLLLAPVVAVFFWKKLSRPTRVMLLAHGCSSAVILFAFIFGTLSSANWRLSPMVFTATVTTVMLAYELCRGRGKRFGVLLLAAAAVLSAFGLLTVARMPADYGQDKGLCELTAYLEQEGFTYGYATFWNAGAVTVLSDSEVKVRNIQYSGADIRPYTYQSQKSWFTDQGPEERYFLLLTAAEYNDLKTAGHPLTAEGTTVLQHGNDRIVPLERALFAGG